MQESKLNKEEIEETLSKITGTKWYAEDGEDTWDLYGINEKNPYFATPKILKAPKRSVEYAEYWPEKYDAKLIVNAPTWIRQLLEENAKMTELIEEIYQHARNDVAMRTGGQSVGTSCFTSLHYPQKLKKRAEEILYGGEQK